jgi:hypothetical protein
LFLAIDIKLQRQRKLALKVREGKLKYTSTILFSLQNTIFLIVTRVAETLPQEVLTKMYAPPKPNYPIITPEILSTFDAFVLGIPTRFGNMPAQWKVRSH